MKLGIALVCGFVSACTSAEPKQSPESLASSRAPAHLVGDASHSLQIAALASTAAPVAVARLAPVQGLSTWYGLLHAHTLISDGSGTPEEAYTRSKAKGLDFFAVTPHNHVAAENSAEERRDGVLIAHTPALYGDGPPVSVHREWSDDGTPMEEDLMVTPLQRAAREAKTASFLPLFGQEFSSISSGNHVNVFGYPDVLTAANGDFRALARSILAHEKKSGHSLVVQLNHPDIHGDLFYSGGNESALSHMFNDYGYDDFGFDFASLVATIDKYVHVLELLTGPAMAEHRVPNFSYRSHNENENDYYFYLVQGLHISPSVGHDNHYKTWGDVTDARMGVLAPSLSEDAILDGMRHNRTFATEDLTLEARLTINGSLMGDNLTLQPGDSLSIEVHIRDADEPAAAYQVDLLQGLVSPEKDGHVTEWKAEDGFQEELDRQGDGIVSFAGFQATGKPEFYYVRLTQDGDDRLWTAPVWINHPRKYDQPLWVWSSSSQSNVYHAPECKYARDISGRTYRAGTEPPGGRIQHACIPAAEYVDDH